MENKSNNKISILLILYDDLQLSYTECKNKVEMLFKIIQNNNIKNDDSEKIKNQKSLIINKDKDQISLINKYYQCDIPYIIHPISKVKEIILKEYEGIIIYLHKLSIANKTFENVAELINENDEYSTCIVLFDESREDIQDVNGYNDFIGMTLDKHFEIIADCNNKKDFNDEDGAGALNLSLHSAMWSSSVKKEEINKVKKEQKEDIDIKKIEEKKKEGYDLLNDQDEIDKLFGKIKEMKLMNANPNISDEERRNNAEKAALMLAEMFGLDEDDENEEENEENK